MKDPLDEFRPDDWDDEMAEQLDPQVLEQMEERTDDLIKDRLKARFNFEDDEIKTQFPDRKTLRAFYQDSQGVRKIKKTLDEDEDAPEDEYVLPPDQERDIDDKLARRKKAQKRRDELLVKQGEEMIGEEKPKKKSKGKKSAKKATKKTASKKKVKPFSEMPEVDTAKPPESLEDILGKGFSLDDVD